MQDILVLYHSHRGSVRALAERIACGIESVGGTQARLRTVPRVSSVCEAVEPAIPDTGAPYVELADLDECSALALGSPVRFGNMAAPMKYFWDSTIAAWDEAIEEDEEASREEPAGRDGKALRQRIARGFYGRVAGAGHEDPVDGYDIVTTLDLDLQDVADKALRRQLEAQNAIWGTTIVMEVETGEILAMANLGRSGSSDSTAPWPPSWR